MSPRAIFAGLLCSCCLSQAATAQSTAVLSATDLPGNGRVAVNVAAGHGNQEANVAVIAIGDHAVTPTSLVQSRENGPSAGGPVTAQIEDNTLAGSSGLIAVNVAAGNDNQLANLAVIAIGIEAPPASTLLLDQARASQQPSGSPGSPVSSEAVAELAGTAFAGSTGLVQVNLVGGERNSSSNTFALTFAGE